MTSPLPTTELDRREKLLLGLRTSELAGVEIGPLASPLVRREDGAILYVDHIDTAALREKYREHATVDLGAIVEVDAVWSGRTIEEALGSNGPVDYVLASHVVEHAPDLIAWLRELQSALRPGGTIRLAVPDKRFCFDYLRSETRLSDVLAAHYAHARRPQVRELIDSELHHRDVDLGDAWARRVDYDVLLEPRNLEHAFAIADRASHGEYIDVHCWAFTLFSFAAIMRQLGGLGLNGLACEYYFDTNIHEHEFFVGMIEGDQDRVVESWGAVMSALAGERAAPSASELQRQLRDAQRMLADIQNSTSWRITQPLRALVERIRGARSTAETRR
ncbi:MAG TPA: methyltransferase domain-containing protein [Caulobacteraceae bacterium]|jgi:hypothetical protein|nr:methyltransferase domain-containing protein [Caulobacteraceae bacterium]